MRLGNMHKQILGKIKGAVKKVRDNYGYYKAGRKAEFDEESKALKAKNDLRMKNIREGNPEENLKLDKYHSTRGKNYWNKATGGRMG